jgi:hypothetical protein
VSLGNSLERYETVVLPLNSVLLSLLPRSSFSLDQGVDSLSLGVNLVSKPVDLFGQVVDSVLLFTADTQRTAFFQSRSVLAELVSLEVFDQVAL